MTAKQTKEEQAKAKSEAQRKKEKETVKGYLSALLAHRPEDHEALRLLTDAKGFASIEALAVDLLDQERRTLRERERRVITRRQLAGDTFIRRFAASLAKTLPTNDKAGWALVDQKTGGVTFHDAHPGSVRGLLALDLRQREELTDLSGAVTDLSVVAWLAGWPRPDPSLDQAKAKQNGATQ